MGIEPFLVGSAVDCVVAQRLARLLCEECKRPTTIPAEVMRANGFNVGLDLECYEPVGCARCGGSGYKGRVGLYEVMWVSETIRSLAVAREPAETIAHAAVDEGMMRLREDGLEKVRRGLTSIAEIARVAGTRWEGDPTTGPRRTCRVHRSVNLDFSEILLAVVRQQGVRPPHHRRRTADAPGPRLAGAAGGRAQADGDRHARDRLRDPQLLAAPAPRDRLADRLRLLDPRASAASASTRTSSAARSARRSA